LGYSPFGCGRLGSVVRGGRLLDVLLSYHACITYAIEDYYVYCINFVCCVSYGSYDIFELQ
jgi:hypothetical protein